MLFPKYVLEDLSVGSGSIIGKSNIEGFFNHISMHKDVEEKLGKIDSLASKVDSLAHDVELLKLKVLPNDVKEKNTFATSNAIQVRIDVCTITTSNNVVPNASNPLILIGVEKTPTP
jgi:hypothetical protein